jgi:hypothetical protein
MKRPVDATDAVIPVTPLSPAEPLWRIAPTRSDDGRNLADFMMLIPGLASSGDAARRHVAETLKAVCAQFDDAVAFVELNYRLNLLWVSVVAEPGLSGRVAQAIRVRLPGALLVGGQLGAVPTLSVVQSGWRARVLRVLAVLRPGQRRLTGPADGT